MGGSSNVSQYAYDKSQSIYAVDKDEEMDRSLFFILFSALLATVMVLSKLLHETKYLKSVLSEAALVLLVGISAGFLFHFFVNEPGYGHQNNGEEQVFRALLSFSPEIFFMALLPPILFNSGYQLRRELFYRHIAPIVLFAVVGTTISAVVCAMALWGIQNLGWFGDFHPTIIELFTFGSLIAATDTVSVIAVLQAKRVDPHLFYVVFGESALNDAVALVLFNTFADVLLTNGQPGLWNAIGSFAVVFSIAAIGSPLMGMLFGILAGIVFKKVDLRQHKMLELSIYLLCMYVPFIIAQCLHLSGIVTIFFSGLSVRRYAAPNVSHETYKAGGTIFKVAAFIAETCIFLELGMSVFGFYGSFHWQFIFWALLCCLMGRAMAIYPLCYFHNLSLRVGAPEEEEKQELEHHLEHGGYQPQHETQEQAQQRQQQQQQQQQQVQQQRQYREQQLQQKLTIEEDRPFHQALPVPREIATGISAGRDESRHDSEETLQVTNSTLESSTDRISKSSNDPEGWTNVSHNEASNCNKFAPLGDGGGLEQQQPPQPLTAQDRQEQYQKQESSNSSDEHSQASSSGDSASRVSFFYGHGAVKPPHPPGQRRWRTPIRRKDRKISTNMAHILWFAGLRGAVAYACVRDFPDVYGHDDEFTAATMFIVLFTIIIMGGATEFMLEICHIDMNVDEEQYMNLWRREHELKGFLHDFERKYIFMTVAGDGVNHSQRNLGTDALDEHHARCQSPPFGIEPTRVLPSNDNNTARIPLTEVELQTANCSITTASAEHSQDGGFLHNAPAEHSPDRGFHHYTPSPVVTGPPPGIPTNIQTTTATLTAVAHHRLPAPPPPPSLSASTSSTAQRPPLNQIAESEVVTAFDYQPATD